MTTQEKTKVQNIISAIAQKENKSPEEIRHAMQEAIDAAWATAWTPGNIYAQVRWQQLFPCAQKPTVEEFIIGMASAIQNIS